MSSRTNQAGFSAVELLIAIFIGAMFIFTGYQLYGVITKGNQEVSDQSIASAGARSELQRIIHNKSTYNATCATLANASPESYNVQFDKYPANVTRTIECPNETGLPNLRKVTIRASYKEAIAVHALYYTQ